MKCFVVASLVALESTSNFFTSFWSLDTKASGSRHPNSVYKGNTLCCWFTLFFFLFIYLRVRSVHFRESFIRDYFVQFNYCILAFFPHCGKNGREKASEWTLSYSIHRCFLSWDTLPSMWLCWSAYHSTNVSPSKWSRPTHKWHFPTLCSFASLFCLQIHWDVGIHLETESSFWSFQRRCIDKRLTGSFDHGSKEGDLMAEQPAARAA